MELSGDPAAYKTDSNHTYLIQHCVFLSNFDKYNIMMIGTRDIRSTEGAPDWIPQWS